MHKANALSALLQEELALLTAGDLDSFEALQSRKAEVLESLSALMPTLSGEVPIEDGSDVDATVALIDDIKEVLARCVPLRSKIEERWAQVELALRRDRAIATALLAATRCAPASE